MRPGKHLEKLLDFYGADRFFGLPYVGDDPQKRYAGAPLSRCVPRKAFMPDEFLSGPCPSITLKMVLMKG